MNFFNKEGYTLFLAPLAGITNKACRLMFKEMGADVVVSEMVSVNGLTRNNKKTRRLMTFDEVERPIGIQLFGSDPESFEIAAEMAAQTNPDFIDINCGCPVKKVISQTSGSALMKTPHIIGEIVKATKKGAGDSIPVSVKIRSGWSEDEINYLDCAKAAIDNGVDFITLHPRTKSQMFSGLADWSHIKKLKESVSVPVVGNGDIRDFESFEERVEYSGVTSVMIGRGALEEPFSFLNIKRGLEGKDPLNWDINERIGMIKKHFCYIEEYNPELNSLPFMKKHVAWYLKGLPGVKLMRRDIFTIDDKGELLNKLDQMRISLS